MKLEKCRSCETVITQQDEVLDLGNQYLIDFVEESSLEEAKSRKQTRLNLVLCPRCKLLQLGHSTPPDDMYREFWYRSATNEMMRAALKDIVDKTQNIVPVNAGEGVLDIGTNDGTLLTFYPEEVVKCGIDPAKNLESESKKVTPYISSEYFSFEEATKLLEKAGLDSFKHIHAIAMFYDLEDPLDFCLGVKEVLHRDGVFVIQMNYLGGMLQNVTFDNISHEHLCYYCFNSLSPVLRRAGLSAIKVERNSVNGGSFRVYCVRDDSRILSAIDIDSLRGIMRYETKHSLGMYATYDFFAEKIYSTLNEIKETLNSFHKEGKKIYLYGASTRGNTIVQALDLPSNFFKGAAERAEYKWGKYMVGSWVPIVSEEEARKDADVFFLLPWHFWNAIQVREKEWMDNGGIFVIPLPTPKIIGTTVPKSS